MIRTVSSHASEAATAASSVSCRWLDWLRRWLRRVLIATSWLVLATLLYLAAGFGLAWIPTNTGFHPDRNGVEIAVVHNGVHADLLLPLRTPQHNWWELFSPEDFPRDVSEFRYASFGWGNRAFYLETPTWSDVRVTTVAKALMGIGDSAMHVDLLYALPPTSARCRRIWISAEQYGQVVDRVRGTLRVTDDGRTCPIRGVQYYDSDTFYEATGHYHLLRTCNVWTSDVLRASGIRAGFWTPFASSVFTQLPGEDAE